MVIGLLDDRWKGEDSWRIASIRVDCVCVDGIGVGCIRFHATGLDHSVFSTIRFAAGVETTNPVGRVGSVWKNQYR